MLFVEARFLFFFLAVFGVHWALRSPTLRKAWLLGASYTFYAAWDWRFLGLILVSTLVDFGVGRALRTEQRPGARRAWLVASCATNLGMLGFFKYFNFFIGSASALLSTLGLHPGDHTLQILLPVGISFYTFQTLSYTIDVYRRDLEPVGSLLDFALFVGFFPQLVAGPIVRAGHFLPQLAKPRTWDTVAFRSCCTLFLVGFIKKACLADGVAPMVDQVFADPGRYDLLGLWTGVLLYSVQLYGDFSGYSDMAIATAGLLGYHLRLNFDFPYFARSITDFWNRWHISLASWLRDYVYVSLGGGRGPRWAAVRNLMITMGLVGLWHGAAWNFVAFGLFHGLLLVGHREWAARVREGSPVRRLFRFLGTPLTFYAVALSMVLFRAEDGERMRVLFEGLLLGQAQGSRGVDPWWLVLWAVCVLAHFTAWKRPFGRPDERLPGWAYAAGLGFAAALAVAFMPAGYRPFIYFQF